MHRKIINLYFEVLDISLRLLTKNILLILQISEDVLKIKNKDSIQQRILKKHSHWNVWILLLDKIEAWVDTLHLLAQPKEGQQQI